jgi:hypothetical protein
MVHDQEIVGSNPGTIYWMDVSDDASYYIKEKFEIKVAKWGTSKKNIYKFVYFASNFNNKIKITIFV